MRVEVKPLSKRDARKLIEAAASYYARLPFPSKPRVASGRVKLDSGWIEVYVIEGVPCLFRGADGRLYPTILCLRRYGSSWLKGVVVVDKGAAIALSKGAHLMLPGIERVEGGFAKGDIIAAVYGEARSPVMVGVAEHGSEEMRRLVESGSRGKAVSRVHRLGDRIWEASLELEKKGV